MELMFIVVVVVVVIMCACVECLTDTLLVSSSVLQLTLIEYRS